MIIGITGTLGAGKGTIVDYLTQNLHFKHFSVRAYLIEEINKRGLPVNRDSMTMVANELRRLHEPSFIADELYKQAQQAGGNCIIESIRTMGEVQSLRNKGNFYLLAVDAPAHTRYERIVGRNSETDHISFETFMANEQREMASDDPNHQNLRACIAAADFVLDNSGSFEHLNEQIKEVLKQIL